eukprot:CAMPEP_0113615178 /NCGR_PEP_ID=MMETSP0017_2-20120614/7563_1 /TAXON_ID=2856 /ORGANISM="Cylindrotheca closterium" /LENGTH=1063 /DNA_ID=CAMNT_0000524399 /DNA_START=156 /DNA_END=3347 /DNA_ORIENTATION=+ /assembly_acc=CAM_ASM_000147
MTGSTTTSDAESDSGGTASAAVIMPSDKVAAAAEKQEFQRQTPSGASAALLGEPKDPSFEPQEFESSDQKNRHVEGINLDHKIYQTSSLGEVQEDEGKEQGKFNIGKGEEHDKSSEDDDESETYGSLKYIIRKSLENIQQQQVLKGERETESFENIDAKGQEDNDKVNTGKGKGNELSADDTTMDDAESVFNKKHDQSQVENVQQQQQVLKGERETESFENTNAKGQEDNDKVNTGNGKGNELSADDTTMDDGESVFNKKHDQSEVENVQQQQQVLKGERETESFENINAKGQEDNDKVNTGNGNGKGNELSADDTTMDDGESVVNKKHDQSEVENVQQQQQVLKGERETESFEAINANGQEDDSDKVNTGKGNGKGNELSADEGVKRNQREFGTIKQRVLKREMERSGSAADDRKRNSLEEEAKQEESEVEKSETEIQGLKQEEIEKGGTRKSSITAESKDAKEPPKSAPRKGKRDRERLPLPVRPAAPEICSDEADGMRQAAAILRSEANILHQAQDYRNEMAARNLLMHSTLPSYLNRGFGLPAQPNYSPHYRPSYPPSYSLPYIGALPHHHFHQRHPNPQVYHGLEQEHRLRAHGGAVRVHHRLPSEEEEARRAVAESLRLGPRTQFVPITHDAALRSQPSTQATETESQRALAESRRLDPSMRNVPAMWGGALRSRPSEALPAETESRRFGLSSVPLAIMSATSMGEVPEATSSTSTTPYSEELPAINPSSMDQATLDRVHRERKNAKSRIRTANRRKQLDKIQAKSPEQWTTEEQRLVEDAEAKRQQKNLRSRNFAAQKKQEIDRIQSLPLEARTDKDVAYYNVAMGRKKRKIEGDKLRRSRVKELGLPAGQIAPVLSSSSRTASATPTSTWEAPAGAVSISSTTAHWEEEELATINPSSMDQATLDRVRRDKKNAQARLRTAKLREQLDKIHAKPPELWTAEERRLLERNEARRQQKNLRSRSRATETKEEIDRISLIPVEERTEKEIAYYNYVMGQKKRKIEGDKLRRSRVKELGLPFDQKAPGVPARGPLPQAYQNITEEQAKKQSQDPHGDET